MAKQLREPTDEEVQAELQKLQDLRGKIRPHSAFGDDNIALIDVEIQTLKEGEDVSAGLDDDLYSTAQDAWAWLQGTHDIEEDDPNQEIGSLSHAWQDLVQ